jgi:hypothetical protein
MFQQLRVRGIFQRFLITVHRSAKVTQTYSRHFLHDIFVVQLISHIPKRNKCRTVSPDRKVMFPSAGSLLFRKERTGNDAVAYRLLTKLKHPDAESRRSGKRLAGGGGA